jgi:DNA polymerase-3 subunit epsilon
MLTSQASAKSE